MSREEFETYINVRNKEGSGKATSYIRALDLLCEMLHAHPLGFENCRDIWKVQSEERVESLYNLVREQTNKGPDSVWNLPDIPVSYLQKGYCSAALKEFQKFISEPQAQILDYTPQMFCQLSLLWLLEQRENKINSLSAEKKQDFVKFFDGENSQFLFSKLRVDDSGRIGKLSGGKVGTISKEEVTEKIKFLYEETFPYLASLSRKAPEVSQFISMNSFPMAEASAFNDSFLLCLEKLHIFFAVKNEQEPTEEIISILSHISELSSVSRHDKEQSKQYEELTPLPVATFLAGEIFARVGDGVLEQDRSYAKVYDPACGRGCLLLSLVDRFGIVDKEQFQGSEINLVTGSLCKIGFLFRVLALEEVSIELLCELIGGVAPNIKIEDSLARYQGPLREIRNNLMHGKNFCLKEISSKLPSNSKFDVVLCDPPFEVESQDLGSFFEEAHVLFLILCRLLLEDESHSLSAILVPSFFRIRSSDQEARQFMLREFPPGEIFMFRDQEFRSSLFDKSILVFNPYGQTSGDLTFRIVNRGASPSKRLAALFNTTEKLEVMKTKDVPCSVDSLLERGSILSLENAHGVYEKPNSERVPNITLEGASKFWEKEIEDIDSVLRRLHQISQALEQEGSSSPRVPLKQLWSEGFIRFEVLDDDRLTEPEIRSFMQFEGFETKGCAYLWIRGNRIEVRFLLSSEKRIQLFIENHQKRPSRFRQEVRCIFFPLSPNVIDPLYFYYWLRATYDIRLKSLIENKRGGVGLSRAYEENEEYFNEIKKIVLDLDITYPHIATQADLNSLFRDIYSLHSFDRRSVHTLLRGSDIPKPTDILRYLLRL